MPTWYDKTTADTLLAGKAAAAALTAEVSRAQTAEALLAPLASPAFTGAPTIGGVAVAKTSDISTAISTLVGAAPSALDTLKEIDDQLTADEGAAAALAATVAAKAPLASPAFTGAPTIGGTAVAKTTDITAAVAAQATSDAAVYPHRVGQLAGADVGGSFPVTIPSVAAMFPGGSQGAATEARGLAVRGRYAYVAANNHFYVLDITTPASPVAVSDLSDLACVGAQEMVLRGRYAYVLGWTNNTGPGFAVIDVNVPSAPTTVGSIVDSTNLPTTLGGIDVRGRYAYVVCNTNSSGTLAVYDISSTTPVYVGKLSSSSLAHAVDVKIRGKYGYIGIDGGGLVVADVSNPYAPTQVATLAGVGTSQTISGNRLYSVYASTVSVVNIANPANPAVVGSYTDSSGTTLSSAYRCEVAGRYLYVASRLANGIAVFDVANATTPALVGVYTAGVTPSSLDHPVNVQPVGRYLYVSCGSYASFGVLDIGGIEQTAAKIDTLATARLDVAEELTAGRASVADSLTVGAGGMKSGGPVTLQGGANLRSGSGAPTLDGLAGKDWYFRTDTPATANQRLYVCTTSGAAGSAVWTGIL